MNKTMQSMMKPINPDLVRINAATTKAEQEKAVLDILSSSAYSLRACDIVDAIPNIRAFPGYDTRWSWRPMSYNTRLISTVCRRLEGKGLLVSTLFYGARLYSIPMVDGKEVR